MMIINFRSFYRSLAHNVVNIPGWRTAKRIFVIEIDDWGSIRIPSLVVLKRFQSKGYDLARSDYKRLDTLESKDDMS